MNLWVDGLIIGLIVLVVKLLLDIRRNNQQWEYEMESLRNAFNDRFSADISYQMGYNAYTPTADREAIEKELDGKVWSKIDFMAGFTDAAMGQVNRVEAKLHEIKGTVQLAAPEPSLPIQPDKHEEKIRKQEEVRKLLEERLEPLGFEEREEGIFYFDFATDGSIPFTARFHEAIEVGKKVAEEVGVDITYKLGYPEYSPRTVDIMFCVFGEEFNFGPKIPI